jgi:apolipoprotein N-acyltransferase
MRRLLDVNSSAACFLFFATGAIFTLSFAPLGCYLLAPLLILPLLVACLYSPPRRVARFAFAFGSGLFLFGTYWLYTSIHVFGRAPLWIAIVLMLGLVVIMSGWFALIGWLTATLTRGRVGRLVLAAPAAWVAVEWFRGWFLTGFPWLSLGYSQIDSPLAGWLPLGGVYAASFLAVFSAAAFVMVLATSGRARRFALALTVLPWLAGAGLGAVTWSAPAGPALKATIVQGGVSQDRKWLPEQFLPTLRLYRDSVAAHADSDLILWPEVAIPAVIDEVGDYLDSFQPALQDSGRSLLLGILERDNGDIYNSVLMLDGKVRQIYRKRHLVPFGEFFPVPDRVREWMRLMSLPNTDMTAGDAEQPLLTTAKGQQLAVAICYEDAYGVEQLYALPDATMLINVSNDAWFGESIAPHQHLEIARVRSLEAGRFTIRATNNGISAFIGPRGEILQTAPQFKYATLTAEVTPMGGSTPYAVLGNWPVIGLSVFLILGLALRRHSHE